MFDDWKMQTTEQIGKLIDRKTFAALSGELDSDLAELTDHYTSVLLENGLIDENGCETELDFDEDDLLEAMLDRFLANHPCPDERAALYAVLVDAFLTLVEEVSEDL